MKGKDFVLFVLVTDNWICPTSSIYIYRKSLDIYQLNIKTPQDATFFVYSGTLDNCKKILLHISSAFENEGIPYSGDNTLCLRTEDIEDILSK